MKTTFRSKLFILLAFVSTLSAAASYAQDSAPSADKVALATAYINSVPVEDEVMAAVEQMAASIQPEQRVLFRSIAEKSIDNDKLRSAAILSAAQIFTEDELKIMTKFYSSPEGKAIRTKMPQYEAKMQPVLTEVLKVFVTKLQENSVALTQ